MLNFNLQCYKIIIHNFKLDYLVAYSDNLINVHGDTTTLENLKCEIDRSMQYLHIHFNESLNIYKREITDLM